MIKKP
jgi:hypothetical protein